MRKENKEKATEAKKETEEAEIIDFAVARLEKSSPRYRAVKAAADEYESSLARQKMD